MVSPHTSINDILIVYNNVKYKAYRLGDQGASGKELHPFKLAASYASCGIVVMQQ